MEEAARSLILAPAKAVNPKVKVVIKYPNWYEHFQGLGFNLEKEPALFDGLYTGTETRDPSGNQHLQPYLGYLIFRFDAMKAPIKLADGATYQPNMFARAAGVAFEQVDRFLGKLGEPVEVRCGRRIRRPP